MISGIYKIKNIVDEKYYIGSSKNINRRWDKHRWRLRSNKHENIILQRAWNKYGEENFIFEIVEECETYMLLELEQKYLNLDPQYNIGVTASGGDNLTNHPNKWEIIENIKSSMKHKIENMSNDEKMVRFSHPMEKNPNWKGGKTHNYCICGKRIQPEAKTCNKCRPRTDKDNPFYNKSHSIKTKKKISEKRKGKYYGNQNIKFIINDIEYFSLGDASKKLKIPITTILFRLKSKNKRFDKYFYSK